MRNNQGFTLAEGTSYCTLLPTKVKFGFTLAEVLITLGVIGVVAAMTIPSLMANYRRHQIETQLKKVHAVLNQAFKLSEYENGEFAGWDLKTDSDPKEYVQKYWRPFFTGVTECDTYTQCGYDKSRPWLEADTDTVSGEDVTGTQYRHALLLNNGTVLSFRIPPTNQAYKEAKINVDINGGQRPNRNGVDYFWFVVTEKGIFPLGYDRENDEINEGCLTRGTTCLQLIVKNGWKIPKNYPVKI